MSNSKKFKFKFNGMLFQLPTKFLRETNYMGNPIEPEINMNQVAAANVIKQYVKKKYPKVVVSATSETFSMGNSVSIYLSDEVGNKIDNEIYDDINNFSNQFKYGYFNGMNDSYEYNSDRTLKTEKGTNIEPGCKFMSIMNKPKHNTVPDIVRSVKEMTSDNSPFIFGTLTIEKAIKKLKDWGTSDSKINKALQLIG